MVEVLLSLDPQDGNDPLEAAITLAEVPRKGEEIEVWIDEGVNRSRPEFLEVEHIVWCSYWPERIVVAVRSPTYDRDEVERILTAIKNGEKP